MSAPATLTFPEKNVTIHLTPELADTLYDAIETFREDREDATLRLSIEGNTPIKNEVSRIKSLYKAGKL